MSFSSDSSSDNNHNLKSIERMNSYPVVNDSLLLALNYYQWIKSKNYILDSSLTMIESTLKTVKNKTEPIVAERLSFIDNTMCSQLEKLERICPIILEPSSKISDIPNDLYNTAIEPSVKILIWPMSKAVDVVTKTSNSTLSTMSYLIESSLKFVVPPSLSTSHFVLDKSDHILDRFLPSEKENENTLPIEQNQPGVYTKVKRLSKKTQRRLYNIAVKEIDDLQKASIEKLNKLRNLFKELQGSTLSAENRFVEGCESNTEPMITNPSVSHKPNLVIEASTEIDQLQDIMTAVASVKKYATTNTIVSLHFINSNLSLLKTILIVNHKLLHQTIKIIEKLQVVLEYIMSKIKVYVKSQKIKEAKCGRKVSYSIFDGLESE